MKFTNKIPLLFLSTLLLVNVGINTNTKEIDKKEKINRFSNYNNIYDEIIDSTVTVYNYVNYNGLERQSSLGSGFCYDEDENYYYLITNHHVVEGSSSLKVLLSNDELKDVLLMGYDELQDVAVLRLAKDIDINMKPLKLNVSESGEFIPSEVGENIFAIGTPASTEYRQTFTKGILSGVDRLATNINQTLQQQGHYIQLDLAINPGNSGGPLLNEYGYVVGVNVMRLTGSNLDIEGLNFALPIYDVYVACTRIKNTYSESNTINKRGRFERADLGTANIYKDIKSMDYKERQSLGIELNQGVFVNSQGDDSILGVENKSIIVAIDGKNVNTQVELRRALYNHFVGEKINLKILNYTSNKYQSYINKEVTLIKYVEN